MKRIISFLLIFLLAFTLVSAIKINGRVELNFQPNFVYEGTVCIIPERIPYVAIEAEGELKKYIELEERIYDFSAGSGCIPYTFTMPEKFETPGVQKFIIWAKQSPKHQGATIGAVVRVGHQIWVDVPYPGKYLLVSLSASNAEAGDTVIIGGSLQNKGDQTIKSTTGRVKIYNWNDELVGTIPIEPLTNIESQESRGFSVAWESGENTVGDYKAVLELSYDDTEDTKDTEFKLGSLEIRLADYTKEVYKKGIVPFDIWVESYWSERVPNVNARVEVLKLDSKLTEFSTLSSNIEPWQTTTLLGYLDTTNLELGSYDANFNLYFGEENRTFPGTIYVVEEPIIEIEQPKRALSRTTKLLLGSTLLFALIAILLIVKILLAGHKREEKEPEHKEKDEPKEDSDQKDPPF